MRRGKGAKRSTEWSAEEALTICAKQNSSLDSDEPWWPWTGHGRFRISAALPMAKEC